MELQRLSNEAIVRRWAELWSNGDEVWPATPWERSKDLMRELPVDAGAEACACGWTRG